MTFQDTLSVEKSPTALKRMMAVGLYSVAIGLGTMAGLMALLLAA